MKTALLYSTGLDSHLTYKLNREAIDLLLYVDFNHTYTAKEMKLFIKNTSEEKEIQNRIFNFRAFGKFENKTTFFIPCRNLLLSIIAGQFADRVWLGGLKEDRIVDNTEEAFADFSRIVSIHSNKDVRVESPIRKYTKVELLKQYLDQGGNAEELMQKTTSCYHNEELYCGGCKSCFRKWVAFVCNDCIIPFYNDKLLQEYVEGAEKGNFQVERCAEILKAVDTMKTWKVKHVRYS